MLPNSLKAELQHPSCGSGPQRWIIVVIAVLSICQMGCVRRRMTIRSNPSGAVVYVDDYEIGTTPVSTDFTYYGKRKIRLVKDGFETLTTMQSIPTPWYEIPPLDFISENLVSGEIRDQRTLTYQLVPQAVIPPDLLMERATDLRRQAHGGGPIRTEPRSDPPPTPNRFSPSRSTIPRTRPGFQTIPPRGRVINGG